MNWKTIKGGAPFIVDERTYFHFQISTEFEPDGGKFYTIESRYISPDDKEPRDWQFVAIVTPMRSGISLFTSNAGLSFTNKLKFSHIKLVD